MASETPRKQDAKAGGPSREAKLAATTAATAREHRTRPVGAALAAAYAIDVPRIRAGAEQAMVARTHAWLLGPCHDTHTAQAFAREFGGEAHEC